MGIKYMDIRNYRFRICGFSKRSLMGWMAVAGIIGG